MDGRVDPPIFLFDGDCAFCTAAAERLRAIVPTPTAIRPWQHVPLGPLHVTEAQVTAAVVMVDVQGTTTHGPEGIAALLRTSTARGWRLAGAGLALRPALLLAWPVYRLIARNRHRLPGGTPACALPPPLPAAKTPEDDVTPPA